MHTADVTDRAQELYFLICYNLNQSWNLHFWWSCPWNIYCLASVWLYITSWEVKNSELWKGDIWSLDRRLVLWTKESSKTWAAATSQYVACSPLCMRTHTTPSFRSCTPLPPAHCLSLCKQEFPSLHAKLKVAFSYSLLPLSTFPAEWKTVSCYT